jgi:ABC-type transporter Mla subunit MlaD
MAEITIRISDKGLKIATVVVFGAIGVWLFAYLYASGAFVPTYRLSVYAPEVGGLSVGSPVLLDGVPVGTVDRVTLAEKSANARRRIELILRIQKRYRGEIRTDSIASATTQGLFGNSVISIQRGFNGAAINAGEEIPLVETPSLNFANLLTKIADCEAREKQSR